MLDLSEMLPVGMVAHGGQVAQIMAQLAQRQRGLPGWEAFHYEKISDSAVELTGGIVSNQSGSKRWLEPHDCITIPWAAVIAEMQTQGLLSTAAPALADDPAPRFEKLDTTHADTASTDYTQMTVTFALPTDALARQQLMQAFHLQANIMGAKIIACRLD